MGATGRRDSGWILGTHWKETNAIWQLGGSAREVVFLKKTFKLKKNKYFFCLHWVLVEAHRISVWHLGFLVMAGRI